jgi:type I restriction enzyme S subunit
MDKVADIPSSWQVLKLGTIAKLIGGGTPPKQKSTYYDGNILWATVRDMNVDIIEDTDVKISESGLQNSSSKIVPKGNIIIATRVGVGKVCRNKFDTAINQDLRGICPNKDTDKQYLFYYLKSISNYLQSISTGATVKGIRVEQVEELEVPIPPLPEQRRIVAKMDSLFERIDRAIELAQQNIVRAEQYIASVLSDVFKELLKNCSHKSVSDISHNIQYGFTGKTSEKGSYRYLRITDIQNGSVQWKDTPFAVIDAQEAQKYLLNNGDILFARTGATAGKSYLFKDDVASIFASYLIRVVVLQDVVLPDFLYLFFQSPQYWQQVFEKVVGAAQPNINGKKLAELLLPVPPMATQRAAVNRIRHVQKLVAGVTASEQQRVLSLMALKSSLLDAAFKGEL